MKIKINVIGLIVINILASVAIPAIIALSQAHIPGMWTLNDSIQLGVLIGMVLTVVETLVKVDGIQDNSKRKLINWIAQNRFEVALSNIKESYQKILSEKKDQNDLFQSYFDDRSVELEKTILDAAGNEELHLDGPYVVNVNVLINSLRGGGHIVRLVHLFIDNGFFFTHPVPRQYFTRIYSLVHSNDIKGVRRLMIYQDKKECNDPQSLKFIGFHASTHGYSYKIMPFQNFTTLLKAYKLNVLRDFGIYGDKYVYVGESNEELNIKGHWLRKPAAIKNFIDFFDDCWENHASTISKDQLPPEKIYIDSLFPKATIR